MFSLVSTWMGDYSSAAWVLLLTLKSRLDLISRPILVVGSVLMQSWQLGSIGWGCTEPVVWTTLGTTCGRCQAGLEFLVGLIPGSTMGRDFGKDNLFFGSQGTLLCPCCLESRREKEIRGGDSLLTNGSISVWSSPFPWNGYRPGSDHGRPPYVIPRGSSGWNKKGVPVGQGERSSWDLFSTTQGTGYEEKKSFALFSCQIWKKKRKKKG